MCSCRKKTQQNVVTSRQVAQTSSPQTTPSGDQTRRIRRTSTTGVTVKREPARS